MIDVSYLYAGRAGPAAAHRYGRPVAGGDYPVPPSAGERRPVVVWNVTRRCNLKCVHCYSSARGQSDAGELTTDEARRLIADLADFGAPVLLLSGGEPLLRPDLFELIGQAKESGLRVVISSNGTLIDEEQARRLKAAGVIYCGLSLDGTEAVNDRFRGQPGAYRRTLEAFRHLKAAGQKAGLRLTLTRHNQADLPGIFDLLEAEDIPRACFYHLVPVGRAAAAAALDPAETRRAVDLILDRTAAGAARGESREILTVDNHCDGAYLLLRLRQAGDPRAGEVEKMLAWNGGAFNASGVGLACVGPGGDVHPDQFWRRHVLGNVRQRPFSAIWMDESQPLLAGLRHRRERLKGRCAACRFLALCGGGLRARAEALAGDPWAADPGCYLTDREIGLDNPPGEGI